LCGFEVKGGKTNFHENWGRKVDFFLYNTPPWPIEFLCGFDVQINTPFYSSHYLFYYGVMLPAVSEAKGLYILTTYMLQ
jgi:hypothetical protein